MKKLEKKKVLEIFEAFHNRMVNYGIKPSSKKYQLAQVEVYNTVQTLGYDISHLGIIVSVGRSVHDLYNSRAEKSAVEYAE